MLSSALQPFVSDSRHPVITQHHLQHVLSTANAWQPNSHLQPSLENPHFVGSGAVSAVNSGGECTPVCDAANLIERQTGQPLCMTAAATELEAARLTSWPRATAAASMQVSGDTASKVIHKAAAEMGQPLNAAAAAAAGPETAQLMASTRAAAAASRHASRDKASKVLQQAAAARAVGQAALTDAVPDAVADAKHSSKAVEISKALTASKSALNTVKIAKESIMIAVACADEQQTTGCIPDGTSLGLSLSDKQMAHKQRESLDGLKRAITVHQGSDHQHFVELCAKRNRLLRQVSHLTDHWSELEEQIQDCLTSMGRAPGSLAAVYATAADHEGAALSFT